MAGGLIEGVLVLYMAGGLIALRCISVGGLIVDI